MVEMKNKVIQYMVDIDHVARKLFVVEGPISLMEFSEELKEAKDIGTPFELQRQAHRTINVIRLHKALQKAMERFHGKPLLQTSLGSCEGIYEFPLEGELNCKDELLKFLDEVF